MALEGFIFKPPLSKQTPLPTSANFYAIHWAMMEIYRSWRLRRCAANSMNKRKVVGN
jgi:hypothetical protein